MTMNWSDIVGHQSQIEMLHLASRRRRLPHALLFTGPAGIGKHAIALTFARALLCEKTSDDDLLACGICGSCRGFDAGNHPDCHMVGLPEGKAIIPISLIAGEGDERGRSGLCHDLALRPMLSRRKVAIIDDADAMNAEAANAFLKTLEEPTPDTMMILVSSRPDSLLPTIRSRCQLMRFHPLSDDELVELMLRMEWVEDRASAIEIATLSEGSLQQASQLLEARWRDLKSMLWNGLSLGSIDVGQLSSSLIEQIESNSSDSAEKREAWNWLLRFTVQFYREKLSELTDRLCDQASDAQTQSISPDWWWTIERTNILLERCLEEEIRRDDNLNISLALEAWLAELSQLTRQSQPA